MHVQAALSVQDRRAAMPGEICRAPIKLNQASGKALGRLQIIPRARGLTRRVICTRCTVGKRMGTARDNAAGFSRNPYQQKGVGYFFAGVLGREEISGAEPCINGHET